MSQPEQYPNPHDTGHEPRGISEIMADLLSTSGENYIGQAPDQDPELIRLAELRISRADLYKRVQEGDPSAADELHHLDTSIKEIELARAAPLNGDIPPDQPQ